MARVGAGLRKEGGGGAEDLEPKDSEPAVHRSVTLPSVSALCVCVCVGRWVCSCMCVCARASAEERERERLDLHSDKDTLIDAYTQVDRQTGM